MPVFLETFFPEARFSGLAEESKISFVKLTTGFDKDDVDKLFLKTLEGVEKAGALPIYLKIEAEQKRVPFLNIPTPLWTGTITVIARTPEMRSQRKPIGRAKFGGVFGVAPIILGFILGALAVLTAFVFFGTESRQRFIEGIAELPRKTSNILTLGLVVLGLFAVSNILEQRGT